VIFGGHVLLAKDRCCWRLLLLLELELLLGKEPASRTTGSLHRMTMPRFMEVRLHMDNPEYVE
jgi:hypothetical protein